MATIKDIARMCGVGVSTVSRAMNNHPDINQETKDRIMQVIAQTNYTPNNSAQNLKRLNAKSIAVLVKGITNSFFNRMIDIIQQEVQNRGYTLILQRVEENENELETAIELVNEKKVQGIIFLGGILSHRKEKLEQLQVPFVLSTSGAVSKMAQSACSTVSVDDFAESYKMVDYLCQLGHKKIAILSTGEDDESIGQLRLQGYKKALEKHKIAYDPELVMCMDNTMDGYSMKTGYHLTKQLLEKKIEFTALYGISDSLAIGACRAITETGKTIPKDYSVAGFDGIEMGEYYNPSLTTISQPVEKMAEATVKVLFQMLQEQGKHQQIFLDAKLVIRESTKSI